MQSKYNQFVLETTLRQVELKDIPAKLSTITKYVPFLQP